MTAEPGDARLLELLRTLGASEDELASTPAYQRGALALELAFRDGRPPMTFDQAAAVIDTTPEDLLRFWRALGFATGAGSARIPATLVDAQRILVTSARDLMGEESALGLARVIGASTARLAEAVVDSFRLGVELPQLGRGTQYADVVADYVSLTRDALPALESIVIAALHAHMVRVAGGTWSPDVEETATRRELAVGFADLVGYTAFARTLTPAELSRLLRRFEDIVSEVISDHEGRLVKQLGDAAMFVAETPDAGAAIGCELAAAFAAQDGVPPVRVGLAFGSVLTYYGDYYGDVVNLAARLVGLARPGTVVVSEDLARHLEPHWSLERLPDQALKGFGAPSAVFRLIGNNR
jgi:adenylate cyclase